MKMPTGSALVGWGCWVMLAWVVITCGGCASRTDAIQSIAAIDDRSQQIQGTEIVVLGRLYAVKENFYIVFRDGRIRLRIDWNTQSPMLRRMVGKKVEAFGTLRLDYRKHESARRSVFESPAWEPPSRQIDPSSVRMLTLREIRAL